METKRTFSSLRERIAFETAERLAAYSKIEADLMQAHDEAYLAAQNVPVVPMVVHNPATGAVHYVEDGVCGFATIKVRPRNSRLAKYLLKRGWRSDSYSRCVYMSVQGWGQSLTRKEAYADAFAQCMTRLGHAGVTADSRID